MSTSRSSISPTCWFARLRWCLAATWPTGQHSDYHTNYLYRVEISLVSFNQNISCVVLFSAFPLIPPISWLSPLPVKKKKKKSASCWLPWWCVFLGWFLLLSISAVSTFFTLLYGFQYGKAKSIKWVMSLGLSLFQSIFILQPLKVGQDGKTTTVSTLFLKKKSINLVFGLKNCAFCRIKQLSSCKIIQLV